LEQGIGGARLDRTVLFTQNRSALPVAPSVEQEHTHLTEAGLANGPSTTREVPPQTSKSAPPAQRLSWTPVLIGALGAMVLAAGAWFALHSRTEHPAAPPATAQPVTASRDSVPATPGLQPVSPPKNEATPAARSPGSTAKPTKEQSQDSRKAEAVSPPVQPAHPVLPFETSPPPQVQPIVTPPKDLPLAPAPAPVPTKAQDDQANRAAEEQAKRIADEQAKRAADEQAKRAVDEQAKRLSDEQAKNTRNADYAAISRALRDYQAAYQRKDLSALQTIWPSIPKQALEGIRGSFHDASEVSMELRSMGDPKVSGNTATVICDRNLHQVILKRAFQASGRVRIVLSRAGPGWLIQSVDSVNQ